MDYTLAVYYALGGAGWSLMRYYYAKMKDNKISWEYKRFLKTLLIGAGIGLYAGFLGKEASPDVFLALSTSSFVSLQLTAVVDTVVNFVIRLFKKYF